MKLVALKFIVAAIFIFYYQLNLIEIIRIYNCPAYVKDEYRKKKFVILVLNYYLKNNRRQQPNHFFIESAPKSVYHIVCINTAYSLNLLIRYNIVYQTVY